MMKSLVLNFLTVWVLGFMVVFGIEVFLGSYEPYHASGFAGLQTPVFEQFVATCAKEVAGLATAVATACVVVAAFRMRKNSPWEDR